MQSKLTLSVKSKVTADLVLIGLSIFLIKTWMYRDYNLGHEDHSLSFLLFCVLTWLLTGTSMGLYQDYSRKQFSLEWVIFFKTLIIYTLVISFIAFQFYKPQLFIRWILFSHCVFVFFFFPVQKLAIRLILLKIRKSDHFLRKVLIVGANDSGFDFYNNCVRDTQYGYKLAGFLDEMKHPALNGNYLGKVSDIESVINRHDLDDIVVTFPHTSDSEMETIVKIADKEGKRLHIIPDYKHFSAGRVSINRIGGIPFVTLRALPLDAFDSRVYKRLFDLLFSGLVIILVLSWLVPVIALLIKLTSKGPVFFKQERWGINKRPITCYKFRSMVCTSQDVDEKGVYQQARRDDPRITRIGKFLRKTNLDELPQFFHVFFGTMSVVGPRPHPVPLNIMSKASIENYMMRNWVKPGITGAAQVKGYRGETRNPLLMKKRVEADIWYMENWTFWLDLQIILQTLVNMVKGEKNAF